MERSQDPLPLQSGEERLLWAVEQSTSHRRALLSETRESPLAPEEPKVPESDCGRSKHLSPPPTEERSQANEAKQAIKANKANELLMLPTPPTKEDMTSAANQHLNQDLTQHLNQDLTQDLKQDLNQDLNQDLSQDLNQDLNQDLKQDLKQDLNQDLNQDVNQDLKQDLNQDPDQNMDRCLDLQDLNQPTDKQPDLNLNQDLYLCEDSKQDSVQDLDQNLDQDLDQDSSGYTELVPQSYVERLHIEHQGSDKIKAKNISFSAPESSSCFSPRVEVTSCFRPLTYQSALMSTENRPLEVGVLRSVKQLLAQVHPKMAALHITKADCEVGRIVQVTPQQQRIMGAQSGVELLTLPHGQQLRLDLLERFETMALALAMQVLGCTGSLEERASLVNRLILTASELRSSVGNLFGFGAVMRALQLPQVSRLDLTWVTLRQRHTEGAVLFEKTLRPFMKNLNEGRESCPLSGTCFPHVLPLLVLMERGAPALQRAGEALGDLPQLWDSDLGVDVLMFHLSAARTMAQLGNVYKTNATSKLQGLEQDSGLEQVFSTEFQMRLLWGHRGASAPQHLRYHKFYQVLTALSHRLEPPRTRTKN